MPREGLGEPSPSPGTPAHSLGRQPLPAELRLQPAALKEAQVLLVCARVMGRTGGEPSEPSLASRATTQQNRCAAGPHGLRRGQASAQLAMQGHPRLPHQRTPPAGAGERRCRRPAPPPAPERPPAGPSWAPAARHSGKPPALLQHPGTFLGLGRRRGPLHTQGAAAMPGPWGNPVRQRCVQIPHSPCSQVWPLPPPRRAWPGAAARMPGCWTGRASAARQSSCSSLGCQSGAMGGGRDTLTLAAKPSGCFAVLCLPPTRSASNPCLLNAPNSH